VLSISSGVHIVLDKRFAPADTGLMIPETEDGRVLFVIPWQGHALIGTTDDPAEISDHPRATEAEIDYLLRHVGQYFDLRVSRSDITSAWSGLRPLVADRTITHTSNLVREHAVLLSPSGLLSVVGGKWTSYRRMAEDAVDHAVREYALKPLHPCRTAYTPLAGGTTYQADGDRRLAAEYGLPADVAATLNHAYGDRADAVAALAGGGLAVRLHPAHPFIEAQVVYAVQHESALRAMDVLARRIPLALIDTAAATAAAPRVIALMAQELGWDAARCQAEQELVTLRLSDAV
jgi:glycerol-3-phosphate dehydrogenase